MFTGFISLKPESEERAVKTVSLGQSELWSSTNLYRQLELLETLVPRTVCDNLLILLPLTYSTRTKQALVLGLTRSSSAHLQCYLRISTWFSTWNTLFHPLLSARRVC
jgi:hypothetical protein